ncbi:MAG: outer membrane beta-barrel protein [Rhizobiaceae bacterium]
MKFAFIRRNSMRLLVAIAAPIGMELSIDNAHSQYLQPQDNIFFGSPVEEDNIVESVTAPVPQVVADPIVLAPERLPVPTRRVERETRITGDLFTQPVADEPTVIQADEEFETRQNLRVGAEQSGVERPVEEEPFLPVGFRAGTWQVFTRLEQAIGYATNSSYGAGGEPGGFSQTDLNASLQSDWSRHEARVDVEGSYRHSFDSGEEDVPYGAIRGSLRLDLLDGFTGNLTGGYQYTTESTSSRDLSSSVVDRPGVHRMNGSAELVRSGGIFDLALRGSFDRETYENARLDDGTSESQKDRNNTIYEGSFRVAYGASPVLKPFAFAGLGRRIYDEKIDRNGDERSSHILDLRGGVEFDFGEKFSGDVAIGYLQENYDGSTLKDINAPSLFTNMVWSPERGSVVSFEASTSLGGSTASGESSPIERDFLLSADRQIRHNLSANAYAALEIDQYPDDGGNDFFWSLGAGIEYFFNRFFSATADVEYERLHAADSDRSWDGTSFRVGVAWHP